MPPITPPTTEDEDYLRSRGLALRYRPRPYSLDLAQAYYRRTMIFGATTLAIMFIALIAMFCVLSRVKRCTELCPPTAGLVAE